MKKTYPENEMVIRREEVSDYPAVFDLIELAFKNEEHSDHKEQFLVERLRTSEAFVPGLSLVAEIDGKIAGFILLTKISIISELKHYPSLAMAPVAVLPGFQGRGIGSTLIRTAHERAVDLGFTSVVLVGHAGYYPRFGYKIAREFRIELPFDIPAENCMIIELVENALDKVQGLVEYPPAFYE